MQNQISLNYTDNKYNVSVNDTVIQSYTVLEEAYELFKQTIKNNKGHLDLSWEEMRDALSHQGFVQVDDTYKTMSLGEMKFFYHTGKVYYMGDGNMQELTGGYLFFKKVHMLLEEGYITTPNEVAKLCATCSQYQTTYNILEDYIEISYPGFSYGRMRYHFNTGKMDRGTARAKAKWGEFVQCILEQLKPLKG